jgi:hypothetical protein
VPSLHVEPEQQHHERNRNEDCGVPDPRARGDEAGKQTMNYDTRLRKLEGKMPSAVPKRMLVVFVCPQRGATSILVMRPGHVGSEWYTRGDDESEDELRQRASAVAE